MTPSDYVHGYSGHESTRLQAQSHVLEDLLHHDTAYPAGSRVLEAGCGVGAQTVILARRSPLAQFTSIDVSGASLEATKRAAERAGLTNVTFEIGDLFDLRFPDASFDHLFVCFVLEHLNDPRRALSCLGRVLKRGGTLTVIEGDHGSTLFHPHSARAWRTIQALIDLQARSGGDALIGRRLFPLLTGAGFRHVAVSPRFVYADASRPEWVEGFTRRTYIAMVDGVRDAALAAGMMDAAAWDDGIADLRAAAAPDGVFCYTFFKATAVK